MNSWTIYIFYYYLEYSVGTFLKKNNYHMYEILDENK